MPAAFKALGRVVFSDLENKCLNLFNTLISEKATFAGISSELSAKEALVINIEKLLRQSPTPSIELVLPASTHKVSDSYFIISFEYSRFVYLSLDIHW